MFIGIPEQRPCTYIYIDVDIDICMCTHTHTHTHTRMCWCQYLSRYVCILRAIHTNTNNTKTCTRISTRQINSIVHTHCECVYIHPLNKQTRSYPTRKSYNDSKYIHIYTYMYVYIHVSLFLYICIWRGGGHAQQAAGVGGVYSAISYIRTSEVCIEVYHIYVYI